jgi:hypothetical protein
MHAFLHQRVQGPALWLCLVLPSLYSVQKFFGWFGVGIYVIATAGAVATLPHLRWQPGERQTVWLSVITFVTLVVLFAAVYPIANTHNPGKGSDADDALNIAVHELLQGRYPYYARTYLGNLNHDMPGAILLASPFVLLGTSALQNLWWLLVFLLILRRELGNDFAALRWFLLPLTFSPVIIHQLVTGTDHVTNALYVTSGLWWLAHAKDKSVPAIAWGISLSSRGNFLFLVPLAFGWLARQNGWKAALYVLMVTCSICAFVTLPFYLYDPSGFSALEAANRLTRFDEIIPHVAWIIGTGMAVLSLVLAWRFTPTYPSLWRNCALVQAFPVIVGFLLDPDLSFLSYSSFFLCFGVLATATREADS